MHDDRRRHLRVRGLRASAGRAPSRGVETYNTRDNSVIRFLQRRWQWLCVTAFAGTLLAPCAGAWIFGTFYCAPSNHPLQLPQDLAVEPVAFPSASGATIRAWLVATNASRGVVILQHGVHSSKSSLVERARFLSEAGYAVLLDDFQAHGENGILNFLEAHLK